MCPFCIGAAAWAVAGVASAGSLGVLAALVPRGGSDERPSSEQASERAAPRDK